MGSSYSFAGGTGGAGPDAALKPYVRQAYITSGVVTPPNTSGAWQVLQQAASAGPFELSVPAAVGDYVDVSMQTWWTPKSTISVDLGVVVGSSIVRYLSTGTGTPSSRGLPWAHQDTTFKTPSSPIGFTVQSGDLDGGSVRFSVVVKSDGTAADLYATSTFPFYWQAVNHRTVL